MILLLYSTIQLLVVIVTISSRRKPVETKNHLNECNWVFHELIKHSMNFMVKIKLEQMHLISLPTH